MSIEAMRQMVAALEDIKDDCAGCEFEWQNDYPVQCAALEAGRKALAEADEKMRELCTHHNKIGYKQGYRAGRADEREKAEKQEPVAYVPYGVFDAWLDQAWLGVKCLNPQLCDPDKVDVQAVYAYPKPLGGGKP